MEEAHRKAIQNNFRSLVEQTDLDLMVSMLYEKGVFSEQMIEPFKDTNKDMRHRKRQMYSELTRRGPQAFGKLVDALTEAGYWHLVRDLDPSSSLHVRRPPLQHHPATNNFGSNENFVSIVTAKNNPKTVIKPANNNASTSTLDSETQGSENNNTLDLELKNALPVPKFHIVKSTKFFESDGPHLELYRTRGRPRGVLLMLSYTEFRHGLDAARPGVDVDCDNVKYLFSEMDFKTLCYKNLTLKETRSVLSSLAGVLGGAECAVVVVSSHGYGRAHSSDVEIRCSDGGLLSYYQLIDYFNNRRFPQLVGIPKVFIFQMCRGTEDEVTGSTHLPPPRPRRLVEPAALQVGAEAKGAGGGGGAGGGARAGGVATDGARYTDDNSDAGDQRLYSDILIANSTVPGYVSHRDREHGSWYIQTLCEVFAARACDCHVEDLLKLVDQRMEQRFGAQTSSVDQWGFNKRLYLHPGLSED